MISSLNILVFSMNILIFPMKILISSMKNLHDFLYDFLNDSSILLLQS